MQKSWLILLTALVAHVAAYAQLNLKPQLRQYTTENGLPSNGIKGLQWDEKTNFLWISTEAGIVRFNGVSFRSFTKENMPSITSERMLFITRNNAGKIYSVDLAGNIFFIQESKPVFWQANDREASPFYNNFYLLPVSEKLFLKQQNSPPTIPFSLQADKVIAISDTSCVIRHLRKLYYYSISMSQPKEVLSSFKDPTKLFRIGTHYFIVNASNEAFEWNIINNSITPVSLVARKGGTTRTNWDYKNLLWEQDMPNPFLIDSTNIWKINFDGEKLTAEVIFDELPTDVYIKSIKYSEANNLLFIGTDSKGLLIISQSRVEPQKRSRPSPQARNSYYSQIELKNGNILTNEGDIIGGNKTDSANLPIRGPFSFNISYSNDGTLWYTQVDKAQKVSCLHSYNPQTGLNKAYDKIRTGPSVASSGNKIYLVNSLGLGVLDADTIRYEHRFSGALYNNLVFDFQEIDSNTLAIACCKGLLRYNTKSKKLDTLFTKENICVRTIWKYNDYLFFGTYGSGFYIWKNSRLKLMPLDKNKYLLYAHCFVPDNDGFCWISTNRGLFKASINELVQTFEKNTSSVYYHYFGKNDGMDMTELNGGCTPCALKLSNGIISFPSMDGLLWISPKETVPILPGGDIYIDQVMVDDSARSEAQFQQTELPPSTSEIRIQLSFTAWSNKENIYLEYQLNNKGAWRPVQWANEPVIQLSNLPSGKYTLRIRKKNGFGFNNFTYKQLDFIIATPWYKQLWFYGLCVLVVLGIALLIYRLRTRQFRIRERKLQWQVAEKTKELLQQNEILEKNNSLKTRLISIISHDIVTPLKFVTSASKKLSEKKAVMDEDLQQETIREIANTSQELHLLSTNILNWIKYQNQQRMLAKDQFHLFDLVQQVFGVAQSLAKEKSIELVNEVDPALRIYQYFEPLQIALYNVVINAIKFSDKGNISVSCKQLDSVIKVTVRDEGSGMSQSQVNNLLNEHIVITAMGNDKRKGHGLGYIIIKDLLKTMGGHLQIESEKGRFTEVSLFIPV